MSTPDKNSSYYQRLITNMQTSWVYRSLAWVTPRQAGLVFCGSALLTIILIILSIYGDNTNYTYSNLAMVMILLTILAGLFGVISWLDDKYVKDEYHRIAARGGLHFGVFFYLIMMALTILGILH